MVARVVASSGGRSFVLLSLTKTMRAVVGWSRDVSDDDIIGNHFARAVETPVRIHEDPLRVEVHEVIGQPSGIYTFPTGRGASITLGTRFSANFHGRIVTIRVFRRNDEPTEPIFAVLRTDNPWMNFRTGRNGRGRIIIIPDMYFANLNQLKYSVSQASVLTGGSAYQLFTDIHGTVIGDILDRTGRGVRNMCRVWLQVRNRMPIRFMNPVNPNEWVDTFPLESETFPNLNVIGATMTSGTDTLDLRRFLQWRAVKLVRGRPTKKKRNFRLGRMLSHWVR